MERKSQKDAEERLEVDILRQVEDYLKEQRNGGPSPWHESLDETMFWM